MAEQSNSLDTVSGGDDSPKNEILDKLSYWMVGPKPYVLRYIGILLSYGGGLRGPT